MKLVSKIALGVLVLALLGAACSDEEAAENNNYDGGQQVQQEVQRQEEDFIFIEQPACYNDGYWSNIVGVVQNNTGKDLEYIQISFTLYDADDNVIGTAFANANNVKDQGTWKFEAMILEENVVRFELDEISSW